MWERRDPGVSTHCSCKTSVFLKHHIFIYNSPVIMCTEINESIKKAYLLQMVKNKVIVAFDYILIALAYFPNTSYFFLPPPADVRSSWSLASLYSLHSRCHCTVCPTFRGSNCPSSVCQRWLHRPTAGRTSSGHRTVQTKTIFTAPVMCKATTRRCAMQNCFPRYTFHRLPPHRIINAWSK